jgi:hypothetical protein
MRYYTRAPNGSKLKRAAGLAPMDIEILKFLWKWKLSTTSVLYLVLGNGCKPKQFNKRLAKLETNGMITFTFDFVERRYTWVLTALGRQTVPLDFHRSSFKDKGYLSASPNHDFWCLAFLLGEWPYIKTEKPEIVTDQELLRVELSALPQWLPATPLARRADGYARVVQADGPRIFAYEVELMAKSVQQYEHIIRAYGACSKTNRVLWLYDNPYVLAQFTKAKAIVNDTTERYHLFVALEEFKKSGWNALMTDHELRPIGSISKITTGFVRQLCGDVDDTRGSNIAMTPYLIGNKILKG